MLQSYSLALKSIWGNKMRSFLTMLGIIIGVASVIILVSLVNGQMSYMKESFASMGTNQLNVRVTNTASRLVTPEQMYEYYEENKNLYAQMTPVVTISTTIKHGNDSMTATSVTGVSEEYLEMKDQELENGRFIQYSDLVSRQKVCVAGYYVAVELYGSVEKAMDETLKIGGNAYRIVGVVKQQDKDELEEGGSDDFVYMPYSCAVKMARNANISNYIFATEDMSRTDEAVDSLKVFLKEIFKDDDLYSVTAMSELLDSMNSMIAQMSLMLGGIAGISLLVAGVGVMNIMLVSVTERTREIGIRKSLGARPGTILQQFVIEALVTSSLGGVIGIGIGSASSLGIGALMGIEAPPTASAILISFSVSVFIGLVFGYMPAKRAARLNPIDALRTD